MSKNIPSSNIDKCTVGDITDNGGIVILKTTIIGIQKPGGIKVSISGIVPDTDIQSIEEIFDRAKKQQLTTYHTMKKARRLVKDHNKLS